MRGRGQCKGAALAAEELTCTYAEPRRTALNSFSTKQYAGEMVALMGASGAGKTTLLKCLNRIVPCFQPAEVSGRIAVAGRWLGDEKVGDLSGLVGMLFQDFEAQLFSTNVAREVAFGAEQLGVDPAVVRARVADALGTVGLEGLARRDPATLSGGQKQRLAIASLLAMRPQAMLLDEPASDLDPLGREEVYGTFKRLRGEGIALLAVEHEVESVLGADRLLLLREGRLIGDGAPRALLPRIDAFAQAGVRPFELALLARRLGLGQCPLSADEAARAIKGAGWSVKSMSQARDCRRAHPLPGTPALEVDRLSFGYHAGEPALSSISLTIAPGEFVAVVGCNGSGKTTLAKQMSGLLGPDSGRVLIGGRAIGGLSRREIASRVGYVFQNPDNQLFAATVYEEVAFGPRNFGVSGGDLEKRVGRALEAVGLDRLAGEDPFLLSKGERQRLAIASVISLDPEVLILDEPTTGLDYQQTLEVMDLVAELNRQGRTIVMITHTPWLVARWARRVLLMAGGRLLWQGSPGEFFCRADLLGEAAFHAPPVVEVGRALGVGVLTVDELAAALARRVDS